jgi:hypothetical protein
VGLPDWILFLSLELVLIAALLRMCVAQYLKSSGFSLSELYGNFWGLHNVFIVMVVWVLCLWLSAFMSILYSSSSSLQMYVQIWEL